MIHKKAKFVKTDKGVAPVIGFLLIVAIAFLAAGQYQTEVVPQQEREAESSHYKDVRGDMRSITSSIIQAAGSGQIQTQSVNTGVDYDVAGFTQPPVPGVLLHIDAQQPIEIHNATNDREASEFWNGTVKEYDTGFLGYTVDYNRFSGASDLYIEHGMLYQDNIPGLKPREYIEQTGTDSPPLRLIQETQQPIFDGRTITLYNLRDGLSNSELTAANVGSTSVSLKPTSPRSGGDMNTLTVQGPDDDTSINIVLPTRLPVQEWREILDDQMYNFSDPSSGGGYIVNINDSSTSSLVGAGEDAVEIKMKKGEIYNLRLADIKVQTQGQRTPTRPQVGEYVSVPTPPGNISENSSVILEAEARDKYNNGVVGKRVLVEAETDGNSSCIGDFQISSDETTQCTGSMNDDDNQPGLDVSNQNGEVSYRYESPEDLENTSISFVYRFND